MNDPIVDEVRRIRDSHAARFNYDLDAIFQDVKEQEKKSGRKFVSVAQPVTKPKNFWELQAHELITGTGNPETPAIATFLTLLNKKGWAVIKTLRDAGGDLSSEELAQRSGIRAREIGSTMHHLAAAAGKVRLRLDQLVRRIEAMSDEDRKRVTADAEPDTHGSFYSMPSCVQEQIRSLAEVTAFNERCGHGYMFRPTPRRRR